MRTKINHAQTILETGTILIIRTETGEEAEKVAIAAVEGGIKVLEVTLTVPNALRVIANLAQKYKGTDIVIGAGTVLDAETANAAIHAGATLLVSPNFNPAMIELANRYQAVTISGAMTPTEILNTVTAGADFVKLFPAGFLGPDYVKTVKAPLPQAAIIPTGGVAPDTVKKWFDAGCAAVGVGNYITGAHKQDGDYGKITKAAETFLAAVKAAR